MYWQKWSERLKKELSLGTDLIAEAFAGEWEPFSAGDRETGRGLTRLRGSPLAEMVSAQQVALVPEPSSVCPLIEVCQKHARIPVTTTQGCVTMPSLVVLEGNRGKRRAVVNIIPTLSEPELDRGSAVSEFIGSLFRLYAEAVVPASGALRDPLAPCPEAGWMSCAPGL
jgi:hypothetical protein